MVSGGNNEKEEDKLKSLSADEFVEILKKHYIPEHGVINVAGALEGLPPEDIDVEESCKNLYENPDFAQYHYYALVALRSLLVRRQLSVKSIELLLEMTMKFGKLDFDEFYHTIAAFSHARPYFIRVWLLEQFVKLYESREVTDGGWFAYHVLGSLLEEPDANFTGPTGRNLLKMLTPLAQKELDENRRSQMFETLEKLRQRMNE